MVLPVSSRLSRRAPAHGKEGAGGVTVDPTEEPRPPITLGDGGINGVASVLTGITTGPGKRGGWREGVVSVDLTEESDPTITLGNGGINGVAGVVTDGTTGTSARWRGGACLLYTSPSPRDQRGSRMPSSA